MDLLRRWTIFFLPATTLEHTYLILHTGTLSACKAGIVSHLNKKKIHCVSGTAMLKTESPPSSTRCSQHFEKITADFDTFCSKQFCFPMSYMCWIRILRWNVQRTIFVSSGVKLEGIKAFGQMNSVVISFS